MPSIMMAAVESRDTRPEMIVRSLVHRLGFRFRLHRRDLPGTPDIVLPRLRKNINVHGCFWHMHTCRHARREPVANADYWRKKRRRNAARDKRNLVEVRKLAWEVLTVWECEVRDPEQLTARLSRFLSARVVKNHGRRASGTTTRRSAFASGGWRSSSSCTHRWSGDRASRV